MSIFKKYNDRYGHPAGDSVLRAVGSVVEQVVRAGDLAARYGGEEFVVVLPSTDRDGAVAFAERIRDAILALEFTMLMRKVACSPQVLEWSASILALIL